MRSISADLLAAQQSQSAEPYVKVQIQNVINDATRYDLAQVDATANTLGPHDAACTADGQLHRVRVTGGTVSYQRSAAAGPYTAAWGTVATGMGTCVAICASGTRVAIFYTDSTDKNVTVRESTNSGTTFGGAVAVVTLGNAALDLAACYKTSAGDMAVGWVQAGGVAMGVIKRTAAGAWGGASGVLTAASWSGIAMTHVLDYEIVLTGVEATSNRPTVWTTVYGDGGEKAAGTWDTLHAQFQAESDASVTYKAPFVAQDGVYRMTFVEADAFTGGATRTYRSSLPLLGSWLAANNWRTPAPVNYSQAYGLAIAVGPTYAFEVANDAVYRCDRTRVTEDVSDRLLQADVRELPLATRGHVDIDNTDGAYAGPPSPLAMGNLVKISFGYQTPAGGTASQVQDLHITGIEYRRTGGVSAIRLHLSGCFEQLARDRQRTSIFHAAGADGYDTIITRMFSRAGISLSNAGASARSGTVKPAFQIAPSTSALTALRQALSFITDRFVPQASNIVQMVEPLATDTSDYTLGDAHPVYEAELVVNAPPVVQAHAIGAGAFGEAIDYTNAAAWLGTTDVQRDLTSTTAGTAAATATAHLRQLALDQPAGRIVCPPVCGLELLDVIDITDDLVAATAVTKRVQGIRWLWDIIAGKYEQTIELGAV